jgi:CRISPR-associated protein Csm2
MKITPMEEKLAETWGLKTAERISDKIFEGASEVTTLRSMLDAEKLVVCSFALGKLLASYEVGLKSAQLRRFYESLLNIKATVNTIKTKPNAEELFTKKALSDIVMLKPQLANAKARQPREVTPFFDVINPLLDRVKTIEDYEKLCQFAEAIVAYHKYCGGRD